MQSIFFHRILEKRDWTDYSDGLDPTADEFDRLLDNLKKSKTFLSSEELVHCIKTDSVPSDGVHLSFDDGFASMVLASDICQSHSVPMTVFVSSQVLQGYVPWFVMRTCAITANKKEVIFDGRSYDTSVMAVACDLHNQIKKQVYSQPQSRQLDTCRKILTDCGLDIPPMPEKYRFLTTMELKSLAKAQVEIGCHGAHHHSLSNLEGDDLAIELEQSRIDLESVTGEKIRYFSYPEGIYDPALVTRIKNLGYEAAFAVTPNQYFDPLFTIARQDGMKHLPRKRAEWGALLRAGFGKGLKIMGLK